MDIQRNLLPPFSALKMEAVYTPQTLATPCHKSDMSSVKAVVLINTKVSWKHRHIVC